MPPPDPTRFDDHSSFLGTFADELIVRARKMDSLVGARHWGTVGRFLENLIADAVRNITPAGFGVSSGFTLVPRGEADDSNQVSREQDLIVFDERYFAPFHRDSGTALVHPSTVAATVQVKRTLDSAKLKDALEHRWDTLGKLLGWGSRTEGGSRVLSIPPYWPPETMIVGYHADIDEPDGVLAILQNCLAEVAISHLKGSDRHRKWHPTDAAARQNRWFAPLHVFSIDSGYYYYISNYALGGHNIHCVVARSTIQAARPGHAGEAPVSERNHVLHFLLWAIRIKCLSIVAHNSTQAQWLGNYLQYEASRLSEPSEPKKYSLVPRPDGIAPGDLIWLESLRWLD